MELCPFYAEPSSIRKPGFLLCAEKTVLSRKELTMSIKKVRTVPFLFFWAGFVKRGKLREDYGPIEFLQNSLRIPSKFRLWGDYGKTAVRLLRIPLEFRQNSVTIPSKFGNRGTLCEDFGKTSARWNSARIPWEFCQNSVRILSKFGRRGGKTTGRLREDCGKTTRRLRPARIP